MSGCARGIQAEYKVHVTTGRAGQKKVRRGSRPEPAERARAPGPSRLARLLALAHHFDEMIREGVVKDQAEIARLMRVTRARVTQVMTLLLLSPDLQEKILAEGQEAGKLGELTEPQARAVALVPEWAEQRRRVG